MRLERPGRRALLVLAACGALGLGPGAEAPAPARKRIEWDPAGLPARKGPPLDADFGWLTVPARRAQPGGGTVALPVLRFRTTSRSPQPPVVYLSGGPGGSGIAAAQGPLLPVFEALRAVADVVVLDQRGTGLARPAVTCRESWSHPLDRAVSRDELLAVARERSRACAAMLRADGIDPTAYNTVESADDLEDLRQALGAPRLQLLGSSYGTQLALTALRRHPGSWARAALVSVKGPEHGLRSPAAFDRQIRTIGRLAGEADLAATLSSLLDRLRREPVAVEIPLPLAGKTGRVTVGAFDLQVLVAQSIADRPEMERLPARLRAMARGDFRELGRFALGLRRGWLGSAMPYAVECSSGAGAERLARIRGEAAGSLLGDAVNFPFPEICAGWEVPDLGPAFREPVRSDVPALLVSATLDVRTPPEDAAEVGGRLSRSTLLTVEGPGHGDDLLAVPEVRAAVREFLRGGAAAAPRPIVLPPLKFQRDSAEPSRER
jgi:pimeloyl-ACP methyl ester carboxylesterase